MKIVFLGVGGAYDTDNPNTSILVESDTKLLLDCGYSVPRAMWGYNDDQSYLDAVFITHAHADHYFGLPVLLMRMKSEGREKPITIICQKGIKDMIISLLQLGFGRLCDDMPYDIKFIEAAPGKTIQLDGLSLTFAPTVHSRENLAIKVSNKGRSFCYSGDGMFTDETEKLYKDSDLVIQETFLFDEQKKGHADILDTVEMMKRKNVKRVAMVHLFPELRKDLESLRQRFKGQGIVFPETDDVIEL